MRENCTYGSEGREQELPYPYRQTASGSSPVRLVLACKSKFGAIALLRYVRWFSPFVISTPVLIAQLAWKGSEK